MSDIEVKKSNYMTGFEKYPKLHESPDSKPWYKYDAKKGEITIPFLEITVKSMEAIILVSKLSRVYFEGEYTGEPKEPDCRSNDGYASTEGTRCSECSYSQWSDTPPACDKHVDLMILDTSQDQLGVLSIKSKSLKPWWDYLTKVEKGLRRPMFSVVTKIYSEPVPNDSYGNSILKYDVATEMSVEETDEIYKMVEDNRPNFSSQGTTYDDETTDNQAPYNDEATTISDEDIPF